MRAFCEVCMVSRNVSRAVELGEVEVVYHVVGEDGTATVVVAIIGSDQHLVALRINPVGRGSCELPRYCLGRPTRKVCLKLHRKSACPCWNIRAGSQTRSAVVVAGRRYAGLILCCHA